MAERTQPDNVARWQEQIVPKWPQASFSFKAPWFYGSLREGDGVIRRSDLGRLISALLDRERERER
jgi:hypothetical protein